MGDGRTKGKGFKVGFVVGDRMEVDAAGGRSGWAGLTRGISRDA